MLDIGIVTYKIRPEGNIIDAVWYSTRYDSGKAGTGIATGDTSNGFPGEYAITYYEPDGSVSGTFNLKIEANGDAFNLSYILNGEVLLRGIGLETSNGLAAGYRKVE